MRIDVVPVNDAPVVHMPDIKVFHDRPRADAIFGVVKNTRIFVTDVDAEGKNIEVKLSAEKGKITLAKWKNVSVSGNGTPTVKIAGPVKWINEALIGTTFTPWSLFSGDAKLKVYANDRGNSGYGGALTDTESLVLRVTNGFVWNWRDWWNRFVG